MVSVSARTIVGLALIAGGLSACGGATSGPASASAPATPTASATVAATVAATPSAGPTLIAMAAGSLGTIVVAGATQMTVYTFGNDRPGVSNCSGACLAAWPALTLAAGQTPLAGPGVTGALGTITRADGSIQVTYNGLPLYFFHNDRKPGDTNGNYTGWHLVAP